MDLLLKPKRNDGAFAENDGGFDGHKKRNVGIICTVDLLGTEKKLRNWVSNVWTFASNFTFQISNFRCLNVSNFRCLNVCIKFQIDCSRHFTFWMWIQPLKQNWNSPLVHVYFSIFIFCMFIFIFICFFCMFIEACLLHLGFIWTSPFWRHYNLKSCPSVGEGVWNLKIWP